MAAPMLVKRVVYGNSAVALYATPQSINYGVQIRLGTEATGRVAVGPSGVTVESNDATDGYQLAAGDSIWIPKEIAGDLTGLFVIATIAAQNVYIIAF